MGVKGGPLVFSERYYTKFICWWGGLQRKRETDDIGERIIKGGKFLMGSRTQDKNEFNR